MKNEAGSVSSYDLNGAESVGHVVWRLVTSKHTLKYYVRFFNEASAIVGHASASCSYKCRSQTLMISLLSKPICMTSHQSAGLLNASHIDASLPIAGTC